MMINRITADLNAFARLPQADLVGFVGSNEKPIQGPVGYLDWLLAGAISRLIERQIFHARKFEKLLFSIQGPFASRLGQRRLFLFGLGDTSVEEIEAYTEIILQTHLTLSEANVTATILMLPSSYPSPQIHSCFLDQLSDSPMADKIVLFLQDSDPHGI